MILTLIAFIFTLSILVFAHEFGHFIAAKKSGIKVEEFGFGIPPRIWGKKIGETIYSLNLLPIGGFVKLFGEEPSSKFKVQSPSLDRLGMTLSEVEGSKFKNAFFTKSKRTRAAVVAAGVAMNFLLAIFAFWVIYLALGIPVKTDKVKVVGILEGSPATEAELKVDDVIVSVEEKKVKSVDEFIKIVEDNKGREVEVILGRQGGKHEESVRVKVIPREFPPEGEGPLGVVVSQMEPRFFPWWQMPVLAVRESIKEAVGWLIAVVTGMGGMIWQLIKSGQAPKDIAGPVGIFQITGMVARQGVFSVIQFIGILSINLVVINILPIPPLDGGKLLFIGVERIIGRKYTPRIEKWVQNLGVILLLVLMVWITINDISRLLSQAQPF